MERARRPVLLRLRCVEGDCHFRRDAPSRCPQASAWWPRLRGLREACRPRCRVDPRAHWQESSIPAPSASRPGAVCRIWAIHSPEGLTSHRCVPWRDPRLQRAVGFHRPDQWNPVASSTSPGQAPRSATALGCAVVARFVGRQGR